MKSIRKIIYLVLGALAISGNAAWAGEADDELTKALRENNRNLVATLADKGEFIGARHLAVAAARGDFKSLELMLAKTTVDVKRHNCNMMKAAAHPLLGVGDIPFDIGYDDTQSLEENENYDPLKVLNLLLARKVNPNCNLGRSSLISEVAHSRGWSPFLLAMLKAKANPNMVVENGTNTWHPMAAAVNSFERGYGNRYSDIGNSVQYLVDAGGDTNLPGLALKLYMATYRGDRFAEGLRVLEILLKGGMKVDLEQARIISNRYGSGSSPIFVQYTKDYIATIGKYYK